MIFLQTKDLQVGIYLTKSYYFLAQYISNTEEDKKLYFQLAKTLSDQYIHKYNDSVEFALLEFSYYI